MGGSAGNPSGPDVTWPALTRGWDSGALTRDGMEGRDSEGGSLDKEQPEQERNRKSGLLIAREGQERPRKRR